MILQTIDSAENSKQHGWLCIQSHKSVKHDKPVVQDLPKFTCQLHTNWNVLPKINPTKILCYMVLSEISATNYLLEFAVE